MRKIFKVADIKKLEKQVSKGEISYSRMVEIMNEMSNSAECEVKKLPIPVVSNWIAVDEKLPDDEIKVLCLHSPSGNRFISQRTLDCLTNDPKWYNEDKPTHWQSLPEAI